MRVGIYIRVSTDDQTTDNQRLQLQAMAVSRGWKTVRIFEDTGISGAKGRDKRPGFDAMLKSAANGELDVVAVWALDRLGRSLKDLIDCRELLKKHNVELYLHQNQIDTSTPTGKLIFNVLGSVAEFEREMISERTKAGLERTKNSGTRLGRKAVDPERDAKILRGLSEGMSYREIAAMAKTSTRLVGEMRKTLAQ